MEQEYHYTISVCIPTYNRAAYLRNCLESVFHAIETVQLQSEILVQIRDNASSDNTREVAHELMQQYPSVQSQYHRNPENIGAVGNFLQLTLHSEAAYTFILGDDDVIPEAALAQVLRDMKQFPNALVFHYKCRQTDFIPADMPATAIPLLEAASRYFYNVGNAGTFIFKTAPAKEYLQQHYHQVASTCWPQTEIMFQQLLCSTTEKPFVVSGTELVISENHNENVIYNSWYIAETFCFSQLRILQHLNAAYNVPELVAAAKKAIPATSGAIRYFFRFLLFVTYYDYPYELEKTAALIRQNRNLLRGRNSYYPLIYGIILRLPRWMKKLLTACYFFMIKPSFKKSTFEEQYRQVAAYQQNKHAVYTAKGKLTADTERYIY